MNRPHLQSKYGLTDAEYELTLASQSGVCAICKKSNPPRNGKTENLSVDHSHFSGANRALLCRRCNWVLGQIDDSQELLLRMLFYLRSHDGSRTHDPVRRVPVIGDVSTEVNS